MSTVDLARACSMLLGLYLVCHGAQQGARGESAAGLALLALVAGTRMVVSS